MQDIKRAALAAAGSSGQQAPSRWLECVCAGSCQGADLHIRCRASGGPFAWRCRCCVSCAGRRPLRNAQALQLLQQRGAATSCCRSAAARRLIFSSMRSSAGRRRLHSRQRISGRRLALAQALQQRRAGGHLQRPFQEGETSSTQAVAAVTSNAEGMACWLPARCMFLTSLSAPPRWTGPLRRAAAAATGPGPARSRGPAQQSAPASRMAQMVSDADNHTHLKKGDQV